MQPRSSFSGDSANLNLLRALAVLFVVFDHLHDNYLHTHGAPSYISAVSFAHMGVLLFFVHTSLVLMLSLERTPLQGSPLLGDFYLRRFFRIYPLAMFCVTAAFLLTYNVGADGSAKPWSWTEYLSNMTLTMDLGYVQEMVPSLWTLPLEVQMYVVLPFLFMIAGPRPVWVVFGIWAVAGLLGYIQPMISGRLYILDYAPCFVAGVIAWRLSLTIKRRIPGYLWPFAFACLWPIFLMEVREHRSAYSWSFCLAVGLAIPLFKEIRVAWLNLVTHTIAKYSFGIYLSHVPAMMIAFLLPIVAPLQLAVFAVLAVIAPILMYHLIEHPMIRIGQRLALRLRTRAAVGMVPAE